jgi:hypothetical protein
MASYHQAYPGCGKARLGRIYAWQTAVGGAWHEVLGYVEVMLRNAIDSGLGAWNAAQPPRSGTPYGLDWLINPAPPLLTHYRRAQTEAHSKASDARARRPVNHPRKHAAITHDDVLAQLTFGNMVYLLPNPQRATGARAQRSGTGYSRVENLWLHGIHQGFSNIDAVFVPNPSLSPSDAIVDQGIRVAEVAKRLHQLRNRVAHHEQTLSVHHQDRHRDATRLVAAIDRRASGALGELSRVIRTVNAAP